MFPAGLQSMNSPTADQIRAHAAYLCASSALATSNRLLQIFTYLLDECLAGRCAAITQYRIGVEACGLGLAFDPRTNPIVRVHASRLRRVLVDYHSRSAAGDGIVIEMPVGEYALRFRSVARDLCEEPVEVLPVVALVEFEGIGLESAWVRLPMLFSEELGRGLVMAGGLDWFGVVSRARLAWEGLEPVSFGKSYPVGFLVDGSIQQRSGGFILRVRLLQGSSGLLLWTWKSPDLSAVASLLGLANDLARWIAKAMVPVERSRARSGYSSRP